MPESSEHLNKKRSRLEKLPEPLAHLENQLLDKEITPEEFDQKLQEINNRTLAEEAAVEHSGQVFLQSGLESLKTNDPNFAEQGKGILVRFANKAQDLLGKYGGKLKILLLPPIIVAGTTEQVMAQNEQVPKTEIVTPALKADTMLLKEAEIAYEKKVKARLEILEYNKKVEKINKQNLADYKHVEKQYAKPDTGFENPPIEISADDDLVEIGKSENMIGKGLSFLKGEHKISFIVQKYESSTVREDTYNSINDKIRIPEYNKNNPAFKHAEEFCKKYQEDGKGINPTGLTWDFGTKFSNGNEYNNEFNNTFQNVVDAEHSGVLLDGSYLVANVPKIRNGQTFAEVGVINSPYKDFLLDKILVKTIETTEFETRQPRLDEKHYMVGIVKNARLNSSSHYALCVLFKKKPVPAEINKEKFIEKYLSNSAKKEDKKDKEGKTENKEDDKIFKEPEKVSKEDMLKNEIPNKVIDIKEKRPKDPEDYSIVDKQTKFITSSDGKTKIPYIEKMYYSKSTNRLSRIEKIDPVTHEIILE